MMYIFHPVPIPTVSLSIPSGTLYEGTSQTLNCSVTLPVTVDTNVNVTVQWTPVVSTDRIILSNVSNIRPPITSTLTFSPLSMADAGQYSCVATVDSSSQYITASDLGQSQEETLSVIGIYNKY